jgi:hypothetical protein
MMKKALYPVTSGYFWLLRLLLVTSLNRVVTSLHFSLSNYISNKYCFEVRKVTEVTKMCSGFEKNEIF